MTSEEGHKIIYNGWKEAFITEAIEQKQNASNHWMRFLILTR